MGTVNKEKDESAYILEDEHCGDCGWPVIHTCVNDEMISFLEDRDEVWDWWLYCSNKGCKNHEGEGVYYNWPLWIVENKV